MSFEWGTLDRAVGPASESCPDTLGGAQLHTIYLPAHRGHGEDSMTIRLADCDGHRSRANMLLNRMYSWRGYGSNHRLPAAPNCITITATSQDDVIGTLTLTVDSPEGMAAARTFPEEIQRFREAPGARLCELTKFAFDTSSPARPRLAALFHIIFIYGSMHRCTDCFIEVNPRHRRFYEAMLGFRCIGTPRTNESVNAPAQLMWLNLADVRRQIDRQVGEAKAGRSLYAHFFSAREERGLFGRLAGVGEDDPEFERLPAAQEVDGSARPPAVDWSQRAG